jgi:hypothetical protein
MALEEAGHLPQHAAMVRLMDEAIEGKQGDTLRETRARRHRRHHLLSACRPEPPARHDRGAARLGAVAPARLGRADHGVRPQGNGEVLRDEAVNRASSRRSMPKAPMPGSRRPRRFLGNDYNADDWEQVTDILDVWFDSGSTHALCWTNVMT